MYTYIHHTLRGDVKGGYNSSPNTRNCLGSAVPKISKPDCPVKEMLRRTGLLSHVILTRSQCPTAAAEGAKLSKISCEYYAITYTPLLPLTPLPDPH